MLCAIPIEIVNRELDAVLYLALHLAKRGIPTVFGDYMVRKVVFELNKGKPVIYFDQDQYIPNNRKILDSGGVVFNLNQEGLILDESLEQPDYENAVMALNMLFAWGEAGKKSILSRIAPEKRDLIKATGHPSFDLVQERFVSYYRNESIVRDHGDDYIQVNTNFSYGNLKMDFDRYIKMLSEMDEWKVYADPEVQKYVWNIHDHQKVLLEEYIALVKSLSKEFPNKHIVFRPHPMEDRSRYHKEFGELENVFVNNRHSVRDWLATAGSVVHYDCTTGVEALLMGKPVIGYRPVFDQEATSSLFGKIGTHVERIEEVVTAINRGRMGKGEREEQKALLAPFLANLNESAASQIAEYALKATSGDKVWLPERLGWKDTLECWRKYVSKLIRARQPGHNGQKVRYALEKFPRTPLREIQMKVEKLRLSEPTLPSVSVNHMAINTFLMVPDKCVDQE